MAPELPKQLRLVDGTLVRRCLSDKPLYCSREGKFYSVHNMLITEMGCVMRELKPSVCVVGGRRRVAKQGWRTLYPIMRNFTPHHCHTLVAGAWLGPRPEGMVIDHINGDIMDWSADNLEYVTPEENYHRAMWLRWFRSMGRDPRTMDREELKECFQLTINN